MELIRDNIIKIQALGVDSFNVYDKASDKLVLSYMDDFHINIKNVTFKEDGVIEGRFLGFSTLQPPIEDEDKMVYKKDKKSWINFKGDVIKSARMVTIKNGALPIILVRQG